MDDNRKEVKWSPRVPKSKLKRLYECTCKGIWDEDLINDVGMTLYLRCRDILAIQQAELDKKVTCPRCDRGGKATLITRRGNRWTPMICPVCGWTMTWVDYHATFQRRQLNPGGAVAYFQAFVTAFESTPDPRARMLAIDRVIHEFHYSLRLLPDQPTRSAGVNLIDGNLGEVITFLNELSGMDLPDDFREMDRMWRDKQESIQWDDILARKREKEMVSHGTSRMLRDLCMLALVILPKWACAIPTIAVGARETVYSAAQRTTLGLNWFPDGDLGVVTNDSGNYRIYAANGSSGVKITGTLSAPATQGVAAVSIYGGPTNYPYQSGGPVYVDPGTSRSLLFYHAEIHPGGDSTHFYALLGVAISDPGSTTSFFDCGAFLQPNMTLAQAVAKTQAVEMCGAPYVVCGTNFLVYFRDTLTNGSAVGLAVARAPVSSVIAAAISHTNVPWQKYYQGSFSQPGIGGISSPLEPGNPGDSWMDVAWNRYLNQYVGTVVNWFAATNTQLNLIFSPDGTNWSTRTTLETDPAESFYPTLVGTGSDPKSLGQSFYIYYTYSVAGAWNRWSDAALSRRIITLTSSNSVAPPAVNNGTGATNITATAARLNGVLTAGVSANIFLLWGMTDGGASANWQSTNSIGVVGQGAFFIDVSALTPSTIYYYRYAATNAAGAAIAPTTATFHTPANDTTNGIPFAWLASFGITNISDSVETNDPDADGLDNLQEYIAGTDPTNPASNFYVTANIVTGTFVVIVQTIQATGSNYAGLARYYDLLSCTSLWSGASWQPIAGFTNLSANGNVIACTNATPSGSRFYRARTWLQAQ